MEVCGGVCGSGFAEYAYFQFLGFLVINKSKYLTWPLVLVVGSSCMLLWMLLVYCSMES